MQRGEVVRYLPMVQVVLSIICVLISETHARLPDKPHPQLSHVHGGQTHDGATVGTSVESFASHTHRHLVSSSFTKNAPHCQDDCQPTDTKEFRELLFCGKYLDYIACPQGEASQFETSIKNAEERAKDVFKANRAALDDDEDCQTSYAAYVCYVHFPKCTNDNRILPVCQSTCRNMLNACNADPVTVCNQFVGDAPSSVCTGGAVLTAPSAGTTFIVVLTILAPLFPQMVLL